MFWKSLFKSSRFNDRSVKKIVQEIGKREVMVADASDKELREKSMALREKASSGTNLDELLVDAYALVREAAKRTLGQRHFDVQLLGGIYLHYGAVVEMLTGEGKTLAATAPAYLNALGGQGVHIITVNEYLAKRDTVWMGQIYNALGLKTACLVHEGAFIYDPLFTVSKDAAEVIDKERDTTGSFAVQDEFLRPISRKEAYAADIVYGANHEFGFDYLRDNLAYDVLNQVARGRGYNFAIIDEVDSILIDEARTPLIIAAPDKSSKEFYRLFSRVVKRLTSGEDYTVDEKNRAVEINESGIDKVEKITGIKNLYSPENIRLVHYLEACLKAQALFQRDRDYIVKDGEVILVDQFTGRLMYGRRLSVGLHQAIEAKEGVDVQEESRTFAQITIQNFFRLYKKISGMTGTAQTSAEEFHKVYGLETVSIPPNKPMIRKDLPDVVYKTADAKYRAIASEVKRLQELGRPVLIGTVSIEKNETMARYLKKAGVVFEILNAKNHEREAQIIAQAGRLGAVTLATNMAGRGVDIILGGNPPLAEEAKKVRELGGLHVIGTERHEARRIDNQLRGRAGRQGDPGSSQFFLSLEDDLMRIFGGERLKNLMQSFHIPDDQPIESKFVSRAIAEAQQKVEGLNFDIRKHLLDYDDVLNKQRTNIYRRRQEILESDEERFREIICELISNYLKKAGREEEEKSVCQNISGLKNILWMKQPVLLMLDTLWTDHLENLEALAESVRIRAYGQHDPLVEYREESYMLFNDLLHHFEQWIFENFQRMHAEMQNAFLNFSRPKIDEVPKVGRNDPCPCGAKDANGRPIKYKRCHGK